MRGLERRRKGGLCDGGGKGVRYTCELVPELP